MILDSEVILSPWSRTFEVILSSEPLCFLVSPSTLDLERREPHKLPFGHALLVRFLQDPTYHADTLFKTSSETNAWTDNTAESDPSSSSSSPKSDTTIATITDNNDEHNGGPFASYRSNPRVVPAHRSILRHHPGFEALFRQVPRPTDNPIVHKLINIDPEAMQLVINFVYLHQVEGPGYIPGMVDWRKVFQLAHRLQLPQLAQVALDQLMTVFKTSSMGTDLQKLLETLFQWGYQHPDLEEKIFEQLINVVMMPTMMMTMMMMAPQEGEATAAATLQGQYQEDNVNGRRKQLELVLESYRDHPEFSRIYGRLMRTITHASNPHIFYPEYGLGSQVVAYSTPFSGLQPLWRS